MAGSLPFRSRSCQARSPNVAVMPSVSGRTAGGQSGARHRHRGRPAVDSDQEWRMRYAATTLLPKSHRRDGEHTHARDNRQGGMLPTGTSQGPTHGRTPQVQVPEQWLGTRPSAPQATALSDARVQAGRLSRHPRPGPCVHPQLAQWLCPEGAQAHGQCSTPIAHHERVVAADPDDLASSGNRFVF